MGRPGPLLRKALASKTPGGRPSHGGFADRGPKSPRGGVPTVGLAAWAENRRHGQVARRRNRRGGTVFGERRPMRKSSMRPRREIAGPANPSVGPQGPARATVGRPIPSADSAKQASRAAEDRRRTETTLGAGPRNFTRGVRMPSGTMNAVAPGRPTAILAADFARAGLPSERGSASPGTTSPTPSCPEQNRPRLCANEREAPLGHQKGWGSPAVRL